MKSVARHSKEQSQDWQKYIAAKESVRSPISNPTVAYGGIAGSYTEEATINYFGKNAMRISCRSFEDVFKSITGGLADYGVIPIENSTTGSVKNILEFLREYDCYIVGETQVKVDHCLMGLPESSIKEITDVYSHEQSLMQCEVFLEAHPRWEQHAWINNGVAAQFVAEEKNPHYAAIAGRRAAELYGLAIFEEHVNFLDINTTRFIVIADRPEAGPENDKISVTFALDHKPGALVRVLNIFDQYHMNLCKIESRPNHVKNWEYNFFIDIEGSLNDSLFDKAIYEVIAETIDFQFLGSYHSETT